MLFQGRCLGYNAVQGSRLAVLRLPPDVTIRNWRNVNERKEE